MRSVLSVVMCTPGVLRALGALAMLCALGTATVMMATTVTMTTTKMTKVIPTTRMTTKNDTTEMTVTTRITEKPATARMTKMMAQPRIAEMMGTKDTTEIMVTTEMETMETMVTTGTEGASHTTGKHCSELRLKLNASEEEQLTKSGKPLVLVVGGSGSAAAAAAHALLFSLLRHALRLAPSSLALRTRLPADLCALVNATDSQSIYNLTIHVAVAWRGEQCRQWRGADYVSDAQFALGGRRLSVLGAGAAPTSRRLLAHIAATAPARCADLRVWAPLDDAACAFRAPHNERLREEQDPPSDWPQCTCPGSGSCVQVLVAVEGEEAPGDAERTHRLVDDLCERARAHDPAPPLRLVSMRDVALRRALRDPAHSFLFLDYDVWSAPASHVRVRPAPPLPCANPAATCNETLDPTVSLTVAESGQLKQFAPRVLGVLRRFSPALATLRRIMDNTAELNPEEAACEAAVETWDDNVRGWLECRSDSYIIGVYLCGENKNNTYAKIRKAILEHWKREGRRTNITLDLRRIKDCDNTDDATGDVQKLRHDWKWVSLAALVVNGAAGEGALPGVAGEYRVPLVLAEAPTRALPSGARAVSGAARPLARALRRLLSRCGWRRIALLREERRTNILEMEYDAKQIYKQVLDAARPGEALDTLVAKDARVIVLSASARLAQRVLQLAQARGLSPDNGYAWVVLGAAGEDWLPPPGFTYVSVSSWWRGGAAPPALGGSPGLRAQLNATLGARWSPLVAPLVDALWLTITTLDDILHATAEYHDLHSTNFTRLFYERLDNSMVEGVTHELHWNATPMIFVHRWSAAGGRLLAAWSDGGDLTEPDLCDAVRDGPQCYTTTSGDHFAKYCHDPAWAILLCTLALAPPALYAACNARRARLRQRDRELEERLLANGGQSAAMAAATAALAPYVVPRASLELLDELGTGQYGRVWAAVLRNEKDASLAVAAKATRVDAAADAETELLLEAALLASLRHYHVVRFAGVCLEGTPLVLMEHAIYGDLLRYLRVRRPAAERARAGLSDPEAPHVAAPALTRLAREAAAALAYLADCRVVHRDVRSANCLVGANRSLKLADFGMARRRRPDEPEYLCQRRAMFPVRWMAPESLTSSVFSSESDVWGLGVLMLELVTLGSLPYGPWPAARVLHHVRAGGVPPLPRDTAVSMRGVVAMCWQRAPHKRPTAAELVAHLAENSRALQPALAREAAAGASPASPMLLSSDENFYMDEWTL